MEAKPSECRSSCANRGCAWGKSLHLFEQSGGCAARTTCLFGGFAGTGVVPESDQCKNAFIEEVKSRCPGRNPDCRLFAQNRSFASPTQFLNRDSSWGDSPAQGASKAVRAGGAR